MAFRFLSLSVGFLASSALGVDFVKEVRPILEEHCFECHGEDKQKNALRLDTTAGILRGGESGEPLVVPGKNEESYLIKRVLSTVTKDQMPPKGDRLSAQEVAVLKSWIDSGATMPGIEEAKKSLALKTDHWSFQPVKRPAGNSVDEFVDAKLREKGLSRSQSAGRATLIRRLFLVMHGMPPTPEEVTAFENDASPDAYGKLVERVLASPRYGERWARHWMDVVRYADSNGFETNRERKTAFHYRDWLVESLNADLPYDVFVKAQIAGDAMGIDAATGFLVAGPYDIVKSPDVNLTLAQRQDELADMVNTTGTAFLGLTMGCARCHNHKFDPILQKDYYAMQAVFAGVNHGERAMRKTGSADAESELAKLRAEEAALAAKVENLRKKAGLRPPVNARANEETFAAVDAVAVRFNIMAANGGEPCIDELEVFDAAGKNVALGGKPTASGTLPGYAIHKLEHINDGKTGNEWSWISNTAGKGWVQIDLPSKSRIQRIVWSRSRDGKFGDRIPTQYTIEAATEPGKWLAICGSSDREPLPGKKDTSLFIAKLQPADAEAAKEALAELATHQKRIAELSAKQSAWLGTFSQPGKTHRLYRGEPLQKREVVAPDALAVLGTLGMAVEEPEQQRRVKLAEWIASPKNPLTARVLVNRLWQYSFGTGIVDTPSDFGANGTRPTHPELLDWLADELVRSGWSIKHIQRLILKSGTFQQSSTPRPDGLAADAGGRLLWRYTPRRLEAEAIRDSMLAVSGALDLKMGGPGFYLMDVVEENVMHYFPKEKFTPSEFRRMVYQFRIRQTTDSVFGSFDCPDGGSVMPKRSRSNTPLQALNLFNSSFVLGQSSLLESRLAADPTADAKIIHAFRLFYSRPPDATELATAREMIATNGVQSFARAMFNTSEFLFVF